MAGEAGVGRRFETAGEVDLPVAEVGFARHSVGDGDMLDVIAGAADELGGGEGANHRGDGAGRSGAQFGALATTGQHDGRGANRLAGSTRVCSRRDLSRNTARLSPREVRVDQPDRRPAGDGLVR
jgi:hypothetical protein